MVISGSNRGDITTISVAIMMIISIFSSFITNQPAISQSVNITNNTSVEASSQQLTSAINGIKVDSNPLGVAVNPITNMIYVTYLDSNIISVIDGKTNDVIKNIPLKNSSCGLVVNPNTNIIFFRLE